MSSHTQTDTIGQHKCVIHRRAPGHVAVEDVFVRIYGKNEDIHMEMSEVTELYNTMRVFEDRTKCSRYK